MYTRPLVTINLVVRNGEKYIRRCLDSVLAQTYDHSLIELNILDNDSTDGTISVVESLGFRDSDLGFAKFSLQESNKNFGMWPGQEELLKSSNGKYIIALSVDIILDPKFIEESIRVMEWHPKAGMLQAKIFQYRLEDLELGIKNYELRSEPPNSYPLLLNSKVIDTVGFKIFRSRRVINEGHGDEDHGQFDKQMEIFGVEGAVPVFRRQAIEDCRILASSSPSVEGLGEFADKEYFWYGDDLDFAWRMQMFGWQQLFAPSVIAHHDRQTTKNLGGSDVEFTRIRQSVPMFKRRLDYRNNILTLIKNDYASNFLRDLPYIAVRQFKLLVYFFVYEPEMFREFVTIAKLLPRMLLKRREVMRRARVSAKEIHKWFQ